MATVAGAVRADRFWQRMAIGLAIFIFFSFMQFAARGLADPLRAPPWVHLHGAAMLAWLGVVVAQPTLQLRGNAAAHRRLGWAALWLALLIVVLGIFTGWASLMLQRFPPFFTAPYFLVLTTVEALAFGAMVVAAVRNRQRTDWHRRLMIGATVMLLEPALGRLLPMPLMMGWSDIPVTLCQLIPVGIMALYDRRTIGHVHRATAIVAGVVIATRAIIYILSLAPPVAALAARIVGG